MSVLEAGIAVITGVGPGMGEATARAFARQGCAVALGARNEARIAEIGRSEIRRPARRYPRSIA